MAEVQAAGRSPEVPLGLRGRSCELQKVMLFVLRGKVAGPLGTLAALIALGGFFLISTGAATDIKKYAASINPTPAPAGSAANFTITIANDPTSSQGAGSVDIKIPTGFSAVTVGTPTASAGKIWTARVAGGVIELRASGATSVNRIDPGQSVSVPVSATVACAAGGTSFTWATEVKQSNDFKGKFNGFSRVGPDPSLSVTGGSFDHLAFDAISTQTAGQPFVVNLRAVDACGNPTGSFSGNATTYGLANALSGATPAYLTAATVPFAAGVASWNVTAVRAGTAQLTATSGTTTVQSNTFTVLPAPATHLAIDQIGDVVQTENGGVFPVTVRMLDQFGNQSPVSKTVVLSVNTGTGTLDDATKGGTQVPSITLSNQSVASFSVTYSKVENDVRLGAAVGDISLTSAVSNAFDVLETRVFIATQPGVPASGSTCLPGRDKTNAQNPTCVTVNLPNGASVEGVVLTEQNCNPIIPTTCFGSLMGIIGAFGGLYSATNPIDAIVELDTSISGNTGVPHIDVLVEYKPGDPFVLVPDCAHHDVVDPEPICLDDSHRQNDGDTELHLIFWQDPRIGMR
jgi:hypothetical protein